jgi:hypothetical protein
VFVGRHECAIASDESEDMGSILNETAIDQRVDFRDVKLGIDYNLWLVAISNTG